MLVYPTPLNGPSSAQVQLRAPPAHASHADPQRAASSKHVSPCAGEATGDGTIKDVDETCREQDDHSGDAGPPPILNPKAHPRMYPQPKMPTTANPEMQHPHSLSRDPRPPTPHSLSQCPWPLTPSVSVSSIGLEVRDNGEVDSDGEVVECGKAALVSDASIGSDSSSVCGVAGGIVFVLGWAGEDMTYDNMGSQKRHKRFGRCSWLFLCGEAGGVAWGVRVGSYGGDEGALVGYGGVEVVGISTSSSASCDCG
uniref:Uncharacterized protein n=1 Tax=Tanacetum cinerariifolium TaxID=118510 RepID=A0A6L2KKH7_TANCI|nr:hypothetical protein [Tanacetum cinerariifolium]